MSEVYKSIVSIAMHASMIKNLSAVCSVAFVLLSK